MAGLWLCLLTYIGPLACYSLAPHILLVVMDDIGSSDFSYARYGSETLTPNIDTISKQGVRFTQHYTSSSSTPTRAALLTGRYAINTGLNFALAPGSIAGLPLSLPTLAESLNKKGYECHMVGKWDLGYSRWFQTPVGRGFKSHFGSFMWGSNALTKQIYREPWKPLAVDWIRTWQNRSFVHYADIRHTTTALTAEAQKVIQAHPKDTSLFLYLAYSTPLQPDPSHISKCQGVPNDSRRKFCGVLVGLDEAIRNVTDSARMVLGDNLVIVVMSDNGASTWFGGSNQPLRSGESTIFEGGIRAPAFVVDYSEGGRYFGAGNRTYDDMVHVSDWMPTLLNLGDASTQTTPPTDGFDIGPTLRAQGKHQRSELVLDLYDKNESMFAEEWCVGIRQGNFKLIEGYVGDPNWYSDSSSWYLNSTDASWTSVMFQLAIWAVQRIFGETPSESARAVLTRLAQRRLSSEVFMLFDVSVDPRETVNLHSSHPHIVAALRQRANELRQHRPPLAKTWLQVPPAVWANTTESGECGKHVPQQHCRFVHPWLADDVLDNQVMTVDANVFLQSLWARMFLLLLIPAGVICLLVYAGWREYQRQSLPRADYSKTKKMQ